MFKISQKPSPSKKSRTLNFDAPSPDNRHFKRLIDRINCTNNLIKPPNGALSDPIQIPQSNLPQSLNLKLFAAEVEESSANIRLAKLHYYNIQDSPHRTGWALQKGYSLCIERQKEACYSENLSPLEASHSFPNENLDFLNRSSPVINQNDISQKMEIETEGVQRTLISTSRQEDSCTSKQILEKKEYFDESLENKLLYFTPSPKKKASIHLKLTLQSIKNERKYFGDIDSTQALVLPSSVSKQTQQYEDQKLVRDTLEEERIKPKHSSEFQVIETIGEGSFGTVFKCKHLSDSKIYAIKRTNRKMKGAYRDLALHEITALDMISSDGGHANVIKYFGNWIEDNNMFIAMEHCSTNLRELQKKRGKFSEEEIVQILHHLAQGLEFLHRHDIVHMDLKPENILFKNGIFKIADFGQSRIVSPSFNGDFAEGDARYLAPELLNLSFTQGSGARLKAADVFSLGMTIYELVANCELPTRGTMWQALRKGQFYTLDQAVNISSTLVELVKAMIDKTPEKRIAASEITFRINVLLKEGGLVKF